VTRPSVATADDDSLGGGGGGSAPLLLGVAGQHFRFATDAPTAVSWCSSVAAGGDTRAGDDPSGGGGGGDDGGGAATKANVSDVEAFIVGVVAGR
jgi:hypothetical protein